MKFFHLSDLHIGRQLHNYNMKEDQVRILQQITDLVREKRPDAVLISGDIYDKTVPSAEAVSVFDEFLSGVNAIEPGIPVLIIAGNHDSGERIDFASSILARHQVYIAGVPPREATERLKCVTLEDEYGPVNFYLLPFVKPSMVRKLYQMASDDRETAPVGENVQEKGEEQKMTFEKSVRFLLEREQIDESKRNVILTHQFYVAGGSRPETADSEIRSVGGADEVDISLLAAFDYAALGHIHRPQKMGRESCRYCGSPLKYSVSEAGVDKTVTMVELGEKGTEPVITELPLLPVRDVRKLRGTLEELLSRAGTEICGDYVSITLTDEEETYLPKERLEEVYDHILELKVDNRRTRSLLKEEAAGEELSDPLTIFDLFFREIQGREMDEKERDVMIGVINEALQWGDEH